MFESAHSVFSRGGWMERGRDRRRTVPAICLLLILLFFATGLAQDSSEGVLPDNPLDGRVLFQNKSCVQCHHLVGSSPGIAPSLGSGSFQGTFLDLGASLWNHAPAMSASLKMTGLGWPQLSPEEATRLLAFLYFIDYLGRPGVASTGEDVFERDECGSCHDIGAGRSSRGPDLLQLQSYISPLDLARGIWNHGPSMFASMQAMGITPPSLREGDLADLSTFLRLKAGGVANEPLLSAPGNPNQGRLLFSKKGCASCHGARARGGAGGPDLSQFELRRPAESIAGIMWNHALAMNSAMRDRGIPWPSFKDSELADLVAFLYFLSFEDAQGDPRRGARVFDERSCAECHAGPGKEAPSGDLTGPDLSTDEAVRSPSALVGAMWNHAPIMKKAILGKGRPWPELSGNDLRDLLAFLAPGHRQP